MILLFVSALAIGQSNMMMLSVADMTSEQVCAESRWLFENNPTDTEGNNDLTAVGGATYTGSPVKQGSYSGDCNAADYYFSIPSISYGNSFTISLWFYKSSGWDQAIVSLYNSRASGDGSGFYLRLDGYNDLIRFYTTNGTTTDDAYGSFADTNDGQWNHIVVVVARSTGTATIYANNTDITTNATIRTDFSNTETGRLAKSYDNQFPLYGYLDAVNVSLFEWTLTDVSTEYNSAGSEICEE